MVARESLAGFIVAGGFIALILAHSMLLRAQVPMMVRRGWISLEYAESRNRLARWLSKNSVWVLPLTTAPAAFSAASFFLTDGTAWTLAGFAVTGLAGAVTIWSMQLARVLDQMGSRPGPGPAEVPEHAIATRQLPGRFFTIMGVAGGVGVASVSGALLLQEAPAGQSAWIAIPMAAGGLLLASAMYGLDRRIRKTRKRQADT